MSRLILFLAIITIVISTIYVNLNRGAKSSSDIYIYICVPTHIYIISYFPPESISALLSQHHRLPSHISNNDHNV